MKESRQATLFDLPAPERERLGVDNYYTQKITSPIYDINDKVPQLQELVDITKVELLLRRIKASAVSSQEKQFLRYAAYRHYVFNFGKIADYYAAASPEMQELMEESALVIIDFNQAIEYGYVQLSEQIATTLISLNEEDNEE